MSGHREFIALLIVGCLLLRFETCSAQNEDSSDYSDNEIDLVRTYRSGIEKVLQGLMNVVSPKSSNSSIEGRLIGFFSSRLPKKLKDIISDAGAATKRGFGDILNTFEPNFHAIFPGTRWCGGGNIANHDEDIGVFMRTDACCRDHDNCPSNIDAGTTKGNLVNNGIFTRSACFCDQQFYECLKNVNSVISANIGTTYFNILRPQCFAYDYPIESCAEFGNNRIVQKKCVNYNLDYSQNKTLEWFDNPDF